MMRVSAKQMSSLHRVALRYLKLVTCLTSGRAGLCTDVDRAAGGHDLDLRVCW